MKQRFLVYGLMVSLLSTCAQSQASTDVLPAKAKAAFDLGVSAYKDKQWDVAIRNFTDAHEAAPKVPRVLFNLALAHAAAGHELTSIPWFKAYLAVAPDAANSDQVRHQIEEARSDARVKMKAIFEEAFKADLQIPNDYVQPLYVQVFLCRRLIELEAAVGEVNQALQAVGKCVPASFSRIQLFADPYFYKELQSPSEVSDNKTVLESDVYGYFVEYLAFTGELDEARRASDHIIGPMRTFEAACDIAVGESRFGRSDQADAAIAKAKALFDRLGEDYKKYYGNDVGSNYLSDLKPEGSSCKLNLYLHHLSEAIHSCVDSYNPGYSPVGQSNDLLVAAWRLYESYPPGHDEERESLFRYIERIAEEPKSLASHNPNGSVKRVDRGSFTYSRSGEFAILPKTLEAAAEPLTAWTELAKTVGDEFSNDESIILSVGAIREMKTPHEISSALMVTGFFVGRALAQIRALENQLSDPAVIRRIP